MEPEQLRQGAVISLPCLRNVLLRESQNPGELIVRLDYLSTLPRHLKVPTAKQNVMGSDPSSVRNT